MASNFALSLASDGLRLLHRVEGGWTLVGEVAGGAADLPSALAALRAKAERLEPGGLRTKLLIPNDQIRYQTLDAARASDDDIRAALSGATPYEVDELVWDTARGGGRTYVAAVARETLEEAEAFAVAHGFAPVSFAAVPPPFSFRGEAYFGPTSVAGAEADARDARPVAIVAAPSEAASAEPARDMDIDASLEPTDDDLASEAGASDPETAPVRPPLTAEPRQIEAAVAFASRGRVVRDVERATPPPLARQMAAGAASGTASFVSRREEPALRSVSGLRPGEQDGRGDMAPRLGAAERPTAAMPRAVSVAAPARAPTSAAPLAASPAPAVQGTASPDRATEAARRAAAVATLEPLPPMPEPAGRHRRKGGSQSDDALAREREQMAAFAERGRKSRGKPRFLGLILTALLLVVMAAVAAWAIGEEQLSAWLGLDDAPTEVAAAPGPDPASGPAPADVSERPPAPPAVAPEPEPEPATAVATADPDPDGTVVPPDEAERFYAATGVWIRAARLPVRPRSEDFELPVSVVTRPAELPEKPVTDELARLVADIGLDKQPVPPPAGTEFAYDERGLILATPEGTVTPAGVLTVAGEPDFVPPTRPGTEPPAIPPEVDLARLELAAAPAAGPLKEIGGDGGAAGLAVANPAALAETAPAETVPVIETTTTLPIPPELPPEAIEVSEAAPPAVPPTRPGTSLSEPATAVAEAPGVGVVEGAPPAAPPGRPAAALVVEETDPEAPTAATADAPAESAPSDVEGAADPAVSEGAPPVVPPTRSAAATPVPAAPPSEEPPRAAPPARSTAQVAPEGPETAAASSAAGVVLAAATSETGVDTGSQTVRADDPDVVPTGREVRSADRSAGQPPAAGVDAPPKDSEVAPVAAKPLAVSPVRPMARSETATPEEVAGAAPLSPLPSFDGPRPVLRQVAAVPRSLHPLPPFGGPRPTLRPAAIAPEPAPEAEPEPREAPQAQPLDVNAALAAIVAGAGDPLAGATAAAVPRALRPDSRPRNFATVVSRARDAAARAAPRTSSPSGPTRQEQEADNEPEVASSAAARPTGPTPGGVAGAATSQDAINLREANLIGVYGRPSDRRALIRLSNGRYVRVSVGDRLEGGQVTAIGDAALNYVVRGRTYLLQIPEG